MENNEILFRCSSLGHIMVNDRTGKKIGETALVNLADIYTSHEWGRKDKKNNKFIEKGNKREEDSITLLSLVNKRFFKKNNIRVSNDFITGEPDLFVGESIFDCEETIDIKTSWSALTFNRCKVKKLDPLYYWQGHGYMWLTGAKKHTVNYCLVNGTFNAIAKEKRIASFESESIDFEIDPKYIEECKQIEINHIFDLKEFMNEYPHFSFHSDVHNWNKDVPKEKRIISVVFNRSEEEIERIKARVLEAREIIKKTF